MRQVYGIYGIALGSDWELPYCKTRQATAILEIVRATPEEMETAASEAATLPSPPEWYRIANLRSGATFMHFPLLSDFLVSGDGRRISALQAETACYEAFQTYLLTHAMSYAMLELGIEHLHATCVLVGDAAIAFLGDSGYGKSTLAATFLRSGYSVITDDLLVLKVEPNQAYVAPGLPHIKMYPDTAQRIWGSGIHGERMNHLTDKVIIPLRSDQHSQNSARLRCFYVLGPPAARAERSAIEITPIHRREAFVELCKAGFNSYMSKPERLSRQFEFATRVASIVPVKQLRFGQGIELLYAVRDAVIADQS
jgi:hypothetical protein